MTSKDSLLVVIAIFLSACVWLIYLLLEGARKREEEMEQWNPKNWTSEEGTFRWFNLKTIPRISSGWTFARKDRNGAVVIHAGRILMRRTEGGETGELHRMPKVQGELRPTGDQGRGTIDDHRGGSR